MILRSFSSILCLLKMAMEGSKISPIIDSIYNLNQIEEFLIRGFLDRNKFGECVIDSSKDGIEYV